MSTSGPPSPAAVPVTPETGRPSNVRFLVLAFLCAMTFVLYLDRVCIGQAAASIQADLKISNTAMGVVFAAFTLAYGLFEVPAGRLGDRYGARGVLTRIVIWWSAFTALTGAAWGFYSLLAVRFLFGAGEAGALPNVARVIARWFPEARRGTAQGLVTMCMTVGGATAPLLAAALIQRFGWRGTFVIFGLLGVIWAVSFRLWFRDHPSDHPRVNAGELALLGASSRSADPHAHPPIPWGHVLRNPNVWIMGALMTCNASVYYFLMSWYPNYLQQARDVSEMDAGKLSSLVLAGGVVGCFLGGTLLDRLIAWTQNRRWSRCGLGCSALILGAVCLLTSLMCDSALASSGFMSLACMFVQIQIPAWWSTVTQISGRHLGAMFGLMNSLGIPGAASSQLFPGLLADWLGRQGYTGRAQWDPGFLAYAGLMGVAVILWLLVNPERTLDPEAAGEPAPPPPFEPAPQTR